ncbi:hypothetical protein PCL_07675 [Purpureocillium lilacinum]|uniref:Uncharacterized protein n=1 Tax=Purpureocillium lilacinum TaxID=33203 RepID=A0A2U3EIM8_PURLI|nr:hypothetical protein Purlil1_2538 [Purpureocillium lilacinum]PWI74361.1 hypothetical protein PCL_07675 [Purpureocillium lilacinum]
MAWHGMGQTGWDRMGGDLARLDAWQGRLRSFRFTNTTAAKPNIGPEPQWQPTQVACLSRRPSECNRHNRMRSRPFGECPHVLRAIARSDNNTAGQRVQRRVSRPRLMQIGAANSSVRGSAQWQASRGEAKLRAERHDPPSRAIVQGGGLDGLFVAAMGLGPGGRLS